jgi:hypothetical protein
MPKKDKLIFCCAFLTSSYSAPLLPDDYQLSSGPLEDDYIVKKTKNGFAAKKKKEAIARDRKLVQRIGDLIISTYTGGATGCADDDDCYTFQKTKKGVVAKKVKQRKRLRSTTTSGGCSG